MPCKMACCLPKSSYKVMNLVSATLPLYKRSFTEPFQNLEDIIMIILYNSLFFSKENIYVQIFIFQICIYGVNFIMNVS